MISITKTNLSFLLLTNVKYIHYVCNVCKSYTDCTKMIGAFEEFSRTLFKERFVHFEQFSQFE